MACLQSLAQQMQVHGHVLYFLREEGQAEIDEVGLQIRGLPVCFGVHHDDVGGRQIRVHDALRVHACDKRAHFPAHDALFCRSLAIERVAQQRASQKGHIDSHCLIVGGDDTRGRYVCLSQFFEHLAFSSCSGLPELLI